MAEPKSAASAKLTVDNFLKREMLKLVGAK